MLDWDKIKQAIKPLCTDVMKEATARQDKLFKPAGSLGELEEISIRMAGITQKIKNTTSRKIHFVFGADNGVYEEGVAAAPQSLTHLLMSNYAHGNSVCAINAICEENGVELVLVDMGIIGGFSEPNIHNHKLMKNGTNNFLKSTAMSRETVLEAMEIGFNYAKYAKENNYDIIGNGEVGMGNTTTAATCIMSVLKIDDVGKAVGRGAGLTDDGFKRKKLVISTALSLHNPNSNDIVDILSKVGGLDIAAMTGLYIGAAYYRLPIVIDGVISSAAALLSYRFQPLTREYMFASHISKEPAYMLAVEEMKLTPILNLGMRLGEGTGCPIGMRVIDTALAVMRNMSTFEEVSCNTEYRENITV